MTSRWKTAKLGVAPVEIIDGDRGENYPGHSDFSDSGYCLFLNAGNVTSSGFSFSTCQFIAEEKDQALRKGVLCRNDVVLTTRGTVGNVAYYSDQVPFEHVRINSGMVIFRSDAREVWPPFLYQFLRSPAFKGQVNSLRSGVAQPQLPIRDIKRIDIPIPLIDEQKRVADILSAHDDLIENNRRRIELLEQAARLLYEEWFVHLRFPGREHVKITDGMPEGWRRLPLGELLVLQRGFDLPHSERKAGTIPVIASTGPNGFHSEAKVKGPGVVTGRSGSLGTVLFVRDDYWPLNTTLWVKEFKRVTPLFAYFLLADMKLDQFNGGAAVPTLNRNDVHRIEVVCPPEELTGAFSDYVSPMYEQIEKLKRHSSKLAEALDLLLPRLMNGVIAV